ncbi:type I-E CRISPR-associated protein Cas6/Cse3/CasE [Roseibium sp. RKSG952]|uniref:type I-E CRISPR-associated protein Cas6/Cse3/CasE n=1 Tax=Roseibium sp. RKSG952 TaxID=2529384 RepID=UPI0012BB978A|nr:type I-E CRISPR-associated protein Cas6/Cse3/CasE [Roseibium sp. RKSG952]MTH95099.1 type I-E CRISPR-associated protein Cas6/Cse3/CasE [Roseibium sp. RKSG952]
MTLYLSRLRLSKTPSARALSGLLSPSEAGPRGSAHHQLLWSAFSDGPDRRRDFLWRENREGEFLTLSERPPLPTDLFEPHSTKEFAPVLAAGSRLDFALRANATRTKRGGQRVDVVMDALYQLPRGQRAPARMAVAAREGRAWLERQGVKAGFAVIAAGAEDYATNVLPGYRGPGKGQPQFGILDLSGQIEIVDPVAFLAQLGKGFGRAKAFGCGLMMIRRAA